MNRLIGIVCFFHVLTSCVYAAEESKEQKQKVIPNAIIWGLKHPIAPIPAQKQINKNEIAKTPLASCFKFKPKIHSLPVFPPSNAILMICKANDTESLITAFKDYFPPYHEGYYVIDNKGNTPLHIACKKNNPTIVELLIENIRSLDTQNNKGQTPLHIACE